MKNKGILFIVIFTTITTFSQKKWTLRECVDQALENNISIQQNKLSVALAEKDVAIAKGNFLPNLNSNINNSGSFGLSTGGDNTRSSADRYTLSLGINAGGTIFNGFRNTNTYKQAQLGVETSKLDLQKIENDISLFVVNGYLNVLFAKENLGVANVQAEISKKQVAASKSRFEAGVIPKGDLLNTQSTLANDLQNVITQENALDIALLNLAQLLQEEVTGFDVSPIDVGSPSSNLLYKNSSTVYDKSITRMPEIERAKLAIENAEFNIEIAKGAFLPTLTYSLGTNTFYNTTLGEPEVFTGTDSTGYPFVLDNRFTNQLDNNLGYSVGLSLNIPIFNGFQTKNNVAKSVINKEIFETRLESEKLQLKQTIEQAFLDVKSSLKAYEAAKISLEAQNEAFKNAQESYNFGALTLFDFDLVRTRLVNAEGIMIRSKYDYVFKTKVLQFYSGELVLE
ncbi:TolC family protein [Polaribacter sp.]|uniref:TolC family protein n=1 Tax=Polaribacter sp. TaxID=1920175 RepID=UPI003EF48DBE